MVRAPFADVYVKTEDSCTERQTGTLVFSYILVLPIEIYGKLLGKCTDSFKRIFGQSTLHGVHIPVRDVDDCLNLCRQVSFNRKNVRSHSSHEC